MPETTNPPGTFCWIELHTTDPQEARRFYTELFGWEAGDIPVGPDDIYTIYRLRGQSVAASFALDAQRKEAGVPSNWLSYVSVENVDDAAKSAAELGGTIIAGPFDVMDAGRMVILSDPGGAPLALWQTKSNPGIGLRDEPGSLGWNDLATPDTGRAGEFYSALFGWEARVSEGEFPYTVFHRPDGSMVGGMYALTPDMPMPSCWLPYFVVEAADEAAARARTLGATVVMEGHDIAGVGRIAMLTDPTGAMFYVIQWAAQQS